MSGEGGLPGGEASRGGEADGEVGGEEDGEEDGEDEEDKEDKRQIGRECPNLVSWLFPVFWATSCGPLVCWAMALLAFCCFKVSLIIKFAKF